MSQCKQTNQCADSASCALMHECAMAGPRLTERVQVGSTLYEKGTLASLALDAVKLANPTPLADAAAIAEREVIVPLKEPVSIAKALLGGRKAHVVLSGGTGPQCAAFLVNIQLTSWSTDQARAEGFSDGFNQGAKWMQNAMTARAALATTEATDAIAPTEGARKPRYDPCDPGNWRDGNDAMGDYLAARPAPSPEAPAVDALTTGAVGEPPLGENKVAYLPKDIQDWGRFRTVATPYFCRPVSLVENWPVPLSMDQGHVLEHSVELRFEDEEDADLFFSMYSDAMGSAAAHPASEPNALTVGQKDALWIAVELLNKADRPVDAEELRALLGGAKNV